MLVWLPKPGLAKDEIHSLFVLTHEIGAMVEQIPGDLAALGDPRGVSRLQACRQRGLTSCNARIVFVAARAPLVPLARNPSQAMADQDCDPRAEKSALAAAVARERWISSTSIAKEGMLLTQCFDSVRAKIRLQKTMNLTRVAALEITVELAVAMVAHHRSA